MKILLYIIYIYLTKINYFFILFYNNNNNDDNNNNNNIFLYVNIINLI
jgi:hypothetical protein